ncbi:MAG: hypothetical protein M3319_13780, partial [Actinomycetota bacterium]|nr:hypothetical protein [Actinomycetota bacterium]
MDARLPVTPHRGQLASRLRCWETHATRSPEGWGSAGHRGSDPAARTSVGENIVSNRPAPASVRTFSVVNGLTLLGVL